MITLILMIMLLILSCLLVFLNSHAKEKEQINEEIKKENSKLEVKHNELIELCAEKEEKINQSNETLRQLIENINSETERLNDYRVSIDQVFNDKKRQEELLFNSYCEQLNRQKKELEEEYNKYENIVIQAYDNMRKNKKDDIAEIEKDLDKIKATRAAAMEAQLKEKEIKEKSSFYCLQIPESDLADAARLEAIKPSLNKPRILSMLIWQTYWQKPLKALSANILGANEVCGIYKITNQKTNECYIGQAVKVRERWAEHAKAGLGIDTPPGNKLYKAMQDYGLNSFSWELLEECEQPLLNEKEKFYIDLYQSYEFGYNSNKGISK